MFWLDGVRSEKRALEKNNNKKHVLISFFSLYFGCYLFGRLIGIPLSTVVSPDTILCSSLAGCLISSLFLVIFGLDAIILFICTGLMGFSTCFLFPSGITWLTKNIQDLKQVSFVFIGSNAANCVFPFLASHLFNEFGPESVFNLTCATEVASIICFLIMILASRKLNKWKLTYLKKNSSKRSEFCTV